MSLRHALLGLLTWKPGTGYELAQAFEGSLINAWHASHSQIYPELAKLEAEGLAEVVGEGPRRSKTYAATDAGLEELRRWLMETEPNRAQRNETALRWFLVYMLEPEQRRAVLERELAFVSAAAARAPRARGAVRRRGQDRRLPPAAGARPPHGRGVRGLAARAGRGG